MSLNSKLNTSVAWFEFTRMEFYETRVFVSQLQENSMKISMTSIKFLNILKVIMLNNSKDAVNEQSHTVGI